MRPTLPVVLLLCVAACADDKTTAPVVDAEAKPPVEAVSSDNALSTLNPVLIDAVLEDVRNRLLPALGQGDAVDALSAAVGSLAEQSLQGDYVEVRRGMRHATEAVAQYRRSLKADSETVDIDVIESALESVDAALRGAGVQQ